MRKLALYSLLVLVALSALGHAGETHKYLGTVTAVDGDSFTLEITDGRKMQFKVTNKTTYTKADGSAAGRTDLAAGRRISAMIWTDGKTATEIKFGNAPKPAAAAEPKVVPVESKSVCMINDRSMAMEQIPVVIDGKTYFGCCPMCKERLEKDEASRYAVDPVSGRKVDKAKAVIGALPGAVVVYFESRENLEKYNLGQRASTK